MLMTSSHVGLSVVWPWDQLFSYVLSPRGSTYSPADGLIIQLTIFTKSYSLERTRGPPAGTMPQSSEDARMRTEVTLVDQNEVQSDSIFSSPKDEVPEDDIGPVTEVSLPIVRGQLLRTISAPCIN